MRFGVHEYTWQRFDQRTGRRRRTPEMYRTIQGNSVLSNKRIYLFIYLLFTNRYLIQYRYVLNLSQSKYIEQTLLFIMLGHLIRLNVNIYTQHNNIFKNVKKNEVKRI